MKPIVPILTTTDPGFSRTFARVRDQSASDANRVERVARTIVDRVRRQGDRALLAYTKQFDGVRLTATTMAVGPREVEDAGAALPREVTAALRVAARRIHAFHAQQHQRSWRLRDPLGLTLGQQVRPLARVGVYVPGGKGAYPSSVLMNAIPARVAGVREIVMASPAGPDGYNPAVLAAAQLAGVSSVYRVGGAQAIAALAYGTKTVPRVDKIVGPGNAFVQAAKKLVYGQVDIDSTAGPSEVLIIADARANPDFVAADLLAQAEHGSGDECALLLTPCRKLALQVNEAVARQLPDLPRRALILRVFQRRAALVVVGSLGEAARLADQVAPEHLELLVQQPQRLARDIHNAGAVFLGPYAPAPLGDYVAGPNHVLPTGGSARFFSPLGVYDFVKRTSVVSASRRALAALAPAITALAELEGYDAHAAAVRRRLVRKAGAGRSAGAGKRQRRVSKPPR